MPYLHVLPCLWWAKWQKETFKFWKDLQMPYLGNLETYKIKYYRILVQINKKFWGKKQNYEITKQRSADFWNKLCFIWLHEEKSSHTKNPFGIIIMLILLPVQHGHHHHQHHHVHHHQHHHDVYHHHLYDPHNQGPGQWPELSRLWGSNNWQLPKCFPGI